MNKTFEIKIKEKASVKQKYPYWAKNTNNDIFYVVAPHKGFAIEYWDEIKDDLAEHILTPLPSGTEIVIKVL